jgi:SAM-dependent methyltransferase
MDKFAPIKKFYDEIYYKNRAANENISRFHVKLARDLEICEGDKLLDVACGTGEWLLAAAAQRAEVSGIDISERAIERCRVAIPTGCFKLGPAEDLPFPDASFDWVTCLGALEHFLDKEAALDEMVRVGKPHAKFVILVPNAGFLTRRLGLFKGTEQAAIHEDILTLDEWNELLGKCGLKVVQRWADLHVLSSDWIKRGSPLQWALRSLQALSLTIWPLEWQYQVFHLCRKKQFSQ